MRRVPFVALALLLLLAAGVHAALGIRGTLALEAGDRAEDEERWADAVAEYRRSAVGEQRARALREAAERSVEHWEEQVNRGGHLAADPALLVAARDDYLRHLCEAPAARYAWDGLSEIYEYVEWVERERRALAVPDAAAPADPWADIGRPGRVSIGLARLALERAPNWFALEDTIVRRLWDFGARDSALEAVDRAARSLPIFSRHRFGTALAAEPALLEAFARASREEVGRTPLIHPVDHLIDLGKVELTRGAYEAAIEALERSLEAPGDAINRAEAHFALGTALMRLERDAEAVERSIQASSHPIFEQAALINLATLAERAGDSERALDALRRLRRLDPRNAEYCLRFAQAARRLERWPAALESLRWARLHHGTDPRVLRALGEIQLDSGDVVGARSTLGELRRLDGGGPESMRLFAAIEDATR